MFLTTHAVIASSVFSYFPSLSNGLVFLMSFLSHFLLDFIPHGDENLIDKSWSRRKKILALLFVGLFDLVFLLVFFVWFYDQVVVDMSRLIIIIFGSILPDGLQFLFFIFSGKENFFTKVLGGLQLFHMKLHHFALDRFNFALTIKQGILLQITLIVVAVFLAIK